MFRRLVTVAVGEAFELLDVHRPLLDVELRVDTAASLHGLAPSSVGVEEEVDVGRETKEEDRKMMRSEGEYSKTRGNSLFRK